MDIRPNQRYWIECPDGSFVIPTGENFLNKIKEGEKVIPNDNDNVWKWTYDRFNEEKEKNNIVFKKSLSATALVNERGERASWNVFNKIWLKERMEEGRVPVDFIDKWENRSSSQELKNLNIPFEFAKPSELIKYLISLLGKSSKDFTTLDFFSGSATTAHAVMQLNAEDGGNRKYIMVQLPEVCDEKSEAYKAGYKNICEIGKERIRRAGEKIKSDETLPAENREKLDIGFKVFKLDSSNIKEWDSETEDLRQSLFDSIDNIKSGRTSLDILYEILLKYGLDLNVPIVENKHFYSIGGGTLLINLDKEIDMEVIDSICEEYKTLLEIDEDFKTTVVLRDSSFANDVDKTNAMKKLEQVGIKEVRSI